MRHLPYADPGTPDLRSPGRFLLWTGRMQWRTLLAGICYGIIWMVAQALVPAAIGRGLQEGVADADLAAAVRWSLVVLGLAGVQAVFGILRHRMAVTNWLAASFRAMQLLGRHSALVGVGHALLQAAADGGRDQGLGDHPDDAVADPGEQGAPLHPPGPQQEPARRPEIRGPGVGVGEMAHESRPYGAGRKLKSGFPRGRIGT